MMEHPTDVPASIQAKLLNWVQSRGDDFNVTLKRYAAERFLYRLGNSPHHNRFVLKGAMLFALWGSARFRPTRDLDLSGYGDTSSESLARAVREICLVSCPDDGMQFLSETVKSKPIREGDEYGGFRVRLQATLGNIRIILQIDIGHGDAIYPPALDSEYPVLLDFLPRPGIRVYPREAVVAEKLHALVQLKMLNSRMKDFYDFYILSTQSRAMAFP